MELPGISLIKKDMDLNTEHMLNYLLSNIIGKR